MSLSPERGKSKKINRGTCTSDKHSSIPFTEDVPKPRKLPIDELKMTPEAKWLYAEGYNDEVRLTFAAHDALVRASNLPALLTALAVHRLGQLQEPTRSDNF